jgi:hypothetical protein
MSIICDEALSRASKETLRAADFGGSGAASTLEHHALTANAAAVAERLMRDPIPMPTCLDP